MIFLTASDDEFNTVTGLTMGADDYVAKPFRPRELLARIAATIRRSQPNRRIVSLGDIRIDTDRAYVERGGAELALSALEYRLLLLFATNPGKLITRDKIRDALWDSAGTYILLLLFATNPGKLITRDKIRDALWDSAGTYIEENGTARARISRRTRCPCTSNGCATRSRRTPAALTSSRPCAAWATRRRGNRCC